jgi:predicted GTPase
MGPKSTVDSLVRWYTSSARPFLEQWSPERVQPLDDDFVRLSALRKAGQGELAVCFLGHSGVGKSTLINALVGERQSVLPAGGVGPMTAQATSVRYAEEPYFKAEYLGVNRLHRLVFAIERHHEAELRRAGRTLKEGDDLSAGLGDDDRKDAELAVPAVGSDSDEGTESKIAGYERQARLMVLGNQFKGDVPREYVIDALRVALGRSPRWGTTLQDTDRRRVDGVRAALEHLRSKSGPVERRASEGKAFRTALVDHASGFLAPLIRTLEVGWPADSLKNGLVLKDLPGLGVANDEYRRVTTEAIRTARAIVLVVDRSGVGEASAQLLHSTGFINSLLHDSGDADAEPVSLMVAVVKLDLSADDEWRNDRQLNAENARRWVHHFDEVCSKAIPMVREQLRVELDRIASEGPAATNAERRAAVERVLSSVSVHPISALEYRKLLAEDDEEPPRIRHVDQSRVPGLIEGIRNVAVERAKSVSSRLDRLESTVHGRLQSGLEVIRHQWQEDRRAQEEIDRIRQELDAIVAPLQKEFENRRGGFREFFRESLPNQIGLRVAEVTGEARNDIRRYLRKYEDYHWATLRAAVRKGGRYDGARLVDLPNELTLRFEEPIAVVWAKYILTSLRQRTSALGNDYVEMTGTIVEWARQQGARVQPKLVEALHDELKGNAKELAAVGKEAIDDLKGKVKTQLYSRVEDRIRKRCQKFVDDGQAQGAGVKRRMLEFLADELTDTVVDAARPAAVQVLQQNYQVVEQDITKLFRRFPNPIETARDQILSSNEDRIRRNDDKRRTAVLQQLEEVMKAAPEAGV